MTKIEWTGETWNPIVGCSIVSPGCTNCYAMRWAAARLDQQHGQFPHYRGTTNRVNGKAVWTGKVALAPERNLLKPLSWKKPRTIFVNSMGDLFHEDVPDEWIDRVFAVMALTPQHTFQVLTKRSARMWEYTNDQGVGRRIGLLMCDMWEDAPGIVLLADQSDAPFAPPGTRVLLGQWPLRNCWLGVSAERQKEADERIPDLLAARAAVRFVSAEPLLGPIDLTRTVYHDAIGISMRGYLPNREEPDDYHFHSPKLDWVIVGGESGHDARPMHPDWARSIRDQCAAASVPFFFKQWGEWQPIDHAGKHINCCAHGTITRGGQFAPENGIADPPEKVFTFKVGKKVAGRLLDGRTHNDMPQPKIAETAA